MRGKPVGWQREPARHALAAKGVHTTRGQGRMLKGNAPTLSGFPTTHERAVIIDEIMRAFSTNRENAQRIYKWLHDNDPASISGGNHPSDEAMTKAIDSLGIPRYEFRLIAGRGKGMQMNWGVDFDGVPPAMIDKWQKELEKHIGEEVYLSGGGGWGVDRVKLIGVKQVLWNEKTGRMGLRAELQRLETKPFEYKKGEIFDPWMDSWQVSVLERVN